MRYSKCIKCYLCGHRILYVALSICGVHGLGPAREEAERKISRL